MVDIFPDTGQIRLAHLASTGVLPFVVDPPAAAWALLVVALGPNCAPVGARPPQIEIQARNGPLASVPEAPATASVVDQALAPVGSASWHRLGFDVFAVQIDITDPSDRPWAVRFTNTDPVELGFVWSTASSPERAQQPRIVMDTTPIQRTVLVGTALPDIVIPISNIGTGPLTINGAADQPMGAGYVLKDFPLPLQPNGCDHLTIGITAASLPPVTSTVDATFVLDCNDPVEQEVTLQLARTEKDKESKEHKDVGKENKDGKDRKEHKDDKDDKDTSKEHPADLMQSASPAGQPPEHFIPPVQRPDLSDSALRDEPPEPKPAEG
ncbi:hypothetical protein [Streptomyces sp. CBMA123]|uniref:hypothetical protein n=1 Tax=Streptomyces sp. CBMA123 TaxID=1896313 RepID=UPI001661D1F6|nr:hypothetical protein [Streptomyces sp. CBMA123]MBD0692923.1 hypothetical protein [Streptomyces sp. CBMA123]